ncbi:13133_t:CDS:2, partial [Entrophospora sp. SA101]
FAEALVKEYWDKLQDPSKTSKSAQSSASSKTTAAATSSKRTVAAASSKSSTVTAPKGKKRLSTSSPSAKQETKSQRSPKKAKTTKTIIKESLDDDDSECWEEEIVAVETVTRDEKTGELLEYSVIPAQTANQNSRFTEGLNSAENLGIPLSYFLGLFGMPGMTAYCGLFKIGQPKKGETIYISTAAGAVGQVACQISKILGLRVVGSAGDDGKVDFLLNELKLDGAFNYKKVDIKKKLKELCPNGIDIYFDNVGGEMLDIVLLQLNDFARVIGCGMISQYNAEKPYRIKNLIATIPKRALYQGFIVTDHYKELYEKFLKDMNEWFKSSKLKYKEEFVIGIENAPEAFLGLLNGKNFGKVVVKIDKNAKL